MKATKIERIFFHGKTELADPSHDMTVNEVLDFYSGQFPELTTATVEGPKIENEKCVYTFKNNVGTKG